MRLDWVDLVWSFSYVQAWLQKHNMLNCLFNCLRLNHLNCLRLNHLNCLQAWLQEHSMLNCLFNHLRLNHLNCLKLDHLNCLRLNQDQDQFQTWCENQIKRSFKCGIQIPQHSENLRAGLLTSTADNSVQYMTAKRSLKLNMLKTSFKEDFY